MEQLSVKMKGIENEEEVNKEKLDKLLQWLLAKQGMVWITSGKLWTTSGWSTESYLPSNNFRWWFLFKLKIAFLKEQNAKPFPSQNVKKLKELKLEHQQFQEEILSHQNNFDEMIRIYRKSNQGSVMKDHYGSLKLGFYSCFYFIPGCSSTFFYFSS